MLDSENTLVDVLIELSQHAQAMLPIREVKFFKIRGATHLLGKQAREVKQEGLVMYPRFEARSAHTKRAPMVTHQLVSVGIHLGQRYRRHGKGLGEPPVG